MAYTKEVNQNSADSHQTAPAYVLTVTRWSNRDSYNYDFNALQTRRPLVIVNDAIAINVQTAKGNPNHTMSCVLKQGDLNYLTAIHPGDYILVNMVNSHEKAIEIRERALQSKPINRYNDGFKGLFKISDVRMQLATLPNGAKAYTVNVQARAFDEFNNNLYFNPAFNKKNDNLNFLTNNFRNFKDVVLSRDKNNVQNLTKEVIKRTLGVGLKVLDRNPEDIKLNQQPIFKVPGQVVSLLNKNNNSNAKSDQKDPYISKVNNYYMGIWDSSLTKAQGTAEGFNSTFDEWKKEGSNWFKTTKPLSGTRQISFENFMNVKVWGLIKDYSNPVINECYTCFRVGKDNYVYPSLIVRQKPFNNRKYRKNKDRTDHTQFLDLPRWKISPDLIYNLNIGRSDTARINFVQVFTRSISVNPNLNAAAQILAPNFVQDIEDIRRHGRKPYIVNCNYDYPLTKEDFQQQNRRWANLVADWVLNGHLKMNGTIVSAGIVDPICIGDNLELDGTVYHIESVNHTMQMNQQGGMSFKTTTSLSMGISERSSETVPVWSEMDYTDTLTRRKDDYNNEKILPGFSDTQDLPGSSRSKGEEVKETREATFTNPGSSNKGNKKR
jgi:hypothetical protein